MKIRKIALIDRLDSQMTPGGDTEQILAIYNYLIKEGFCVTIESSYELKLNCDIAIVFNLQRPFELYKQIKSINEKKIPYIIFPIYWNVDRVVPNSLYRGIKSIIKKKLPSKFNHIIRYILFLKRNNSRRFFDLNNLSFKKMAGFIFENALWICPNSIAESKHLDEEFSMSEKIKKKVQIIYNGIYLIEDDILPNDSLLYLLRKPYVCCVGGIGPRKNQLNLVRAANLSNIPVVIAGDFSPDDKWYYEMLKNEANDNVIFLGRVSKSEVIWLMKNAQGHIQPSFIETPGLASLEAAVLNKQIAVSNVAPVREYFKEFVYYCDPNSVNSIAECLVKLYNSGTSAREEQSPLSKFVRETYLWNEVLVPIKALLK